MNLYLTEGGRDQVPGDLIGDWIVRSDLAPVPRTMELTLNLKDDIAQRVKVGTSLWSGRELLEYEVVLAKQEKLGPVIQDKDQVGAVKVIALLKSCAPITYIRSRAVVLERTSLAEVYRACGAKAAIAEDFRIDRFSCFRGQVPSFGIAQVLQEEGAALVFRDNRLSVKRLQDLLRQDPADRIGQTDTTDTSESPFEERHAVPQFFSTDDTGAFVFGDTSRDRSAVFLPRTSERALRNATRVLVVRKVVDSDLAQQINAGDVLEINRQKYAVITAAHQMKAKDGITESASRFWVGGLVE